MTGQESAADQQNTPMVLFKLITENKTHVLNASRAQGSLAHKDAHVTKPTELESASGMNINRH